MRTLLKRHLSLNSAVAFSLLLKCWQTGSGLLGLMLIGLYFPPNVQGFYYTFASLVALQSFVELGLCIVISNVASHEWSKLNLAAGDSIQGDIHALSRLVSLGRFVFKWYAIAALVFFIIASAGGYWFLSQQKVAGIDWQIPWLLHVGFSSLLLWCMPFLSLLEGCNQVAEVAKFRTWQVLLSNLCFWLAIMSGAELWAAPALSLIGASSSIYYLAIKKRNFFKSFFVISNVTALNWKLEIFPMQWRLALMGFVNYFIFSLFTPVMFHYHGPAIAGQMGMTLQLVGAVQSIALVWISTESPRLGVFVAKQEFHQLDVVWRKATILALSVMSLGLLALQAILYVMTIVHIELANKVLPFSSVLLLSAGSVFALWVHCLALYLRAHLREVFTPVGVFSGLIMGLMVWQLGARYGSLGASASYFLVMSCVSFPLGLWIWRNAKRDWH